MSGPPERATASRSIMDLPVRGAPVARPDPALLARLHRVSSATASAVLHGLGIRQTFAAGPIARTPGAKVVGTAITLQFMPQREDIMSGVAQEDVEQYSALWAVLETIEPYDVLTIDAHGDPFTGCIGDLLTTYFQHRGGAGIVVDGCVRDWPRLRTLGLPVWARGVTPNYASQAGLVPWAYNVPIALSRVLVIPGDIVIADDDGVVIVPIALAETVLERTTEKEAKEDFIRERLLDGGDLRRYYPLRADAYDEFHAWQDATEGTPPAP